MRERLKLWVCAFACVFWGLATIAEEVTSAQAQMAVKNWIRKNPRAMNSRFKANSGEVETVHNALGRALCHVVKLEGGGFVVTSGDTRLSPVVAFSDSGEFSQDPRSPLFALLQRDMSGRLEAIGASQDANAPVRRLMAASSSSVAVPKTKNEKSWDELLVEYKPMLKAVAPSQLDDVRVEPLIKTKWSQSVWGDISGKPMVYNLFTTNHAVCGCAATAGAQILKYWEYPKEAVKQDVYSCTYNNTPASFKIMGGPYAWSQMPLSYEDEVDISDAHRKAIGMLTYDVGVASHMQYSDGESGALGFVMVNALREQFGYASALSVLTMIGEGTDIGESVRNAILASLDAEMPVHASIQRLSPKGGHEVVFDGYGCLQEKIYIHINCGWSGNEDNVWYDVMGESLTTHGFNLLQNVGYNIHPTKTGDVISGRVLDKNGIAQTQVEVSLAYEGNSGSEVKTRTNAKGIYAFRVQKAGTYAVFASRGTSVSKTSQVSMTKLGANMVATLAGAVSDWGCVGNKWGVDLTLEDPADAEPEVPPDPVAAPEFSPAESSFTASSLSVAISCGTYGATIRYTKDGSEPTAASPVYSSSIRISETTTFKARAFKDGMTPSPVTAKTYAKVVLKPTITPQEAIGWPGKVTVSDVELVCGQDAESHDGKNALRISCTTEKTSATASISVDGPGMLSFWWAGADQVVKISGEEQSESVYMSCSLDGKTVASRGRIDYRCMDWRKVEIPVPEGTHVIEWTTYATFPKANRTGYLDEVSFKPYAGGTRTIRFNANGADEGQPEKTEITGAYTDQITMPGQGTLVREGYAFAGWARDPLSTAADVQAGASYTIGMEDETFFACWQRIVNVLVEFPREGGEQSLRTDTYGTKFYVDAQFPEWAGSYHFFAKVRNSSAYVEINLGGGPINQWIDATESYIVFTPEPNDTESDRWFDVDLYSRDYPLVIRYHVVQKGDVVSDKLKGLLAQCADSVVAGQSLRLAGSAVRRNGQVDAVCPTWKIVSGAGSASLSGDAVLKAGTVESAKAVTIRATYGEDDIICTADKVVTVLPSCDLNTALDNADCALTAVGWVGQVGNSAVGAGSARSRSCFEGPSVLKTTVTGPHKVSFDCRVTCGTAGGKLVFVDNGKTNFCACAVPMSTGTWTHRTFYLTAEGEHRLEWAYFENGGDASPAAPDDAAWLDGLSVEECAPGVCEFSFAKKGWHRVSFNGLPDDRSPASVFAPVLDRIASVSECGGSAYWTPTGGDLTALAIGKVYWVETNTDGVNLTVEGAMEPDVAITLKKGWNCIGYPLAEPVAPQDALKSAFGNGKILSIGLAGRSEFYPDGGLETMRPGQVFWVEAPADTVISYDVR